MWRDNRSDRGRLHILLVEDDEVETEALVRAFHKHRLAATLKVTRNGYEALTFLRARSRAEPAATPYLILLDLNMPRMNGLEFLEVLRQDKMLQHYTVFVLTTSDREEDKLLAYDQTIAGYLLKSKMGTDFINLIRFLDTYNGVVEPPPKLPPELIK